MLGSRYPEPETLTLLYDSSYDTVHDKVWKAHAAGLLKARLAYWVTINLDLLC